MYSSGFQQPGFIVIEVVVLLVGASLVFALDIDMKQVCRSDHVDGPIRITNTTATTAHVSLEKIFNDTKLRIFYEPLADPGLAKHENLSLDHQACKAALDNYGDFSGSTTSSADLVKKYCDTVPLNLTTATPSCTATGLLPNQLYVFLSADVECILPGRNRADFIGKTIITTKEMEPMFHPEIDPGSFNIYTREGVKSNRRVHLYWRPVPVLLRSSTDFHYRVRCLRSSPKVIDIDEIVAADKGLIEIDRLIAPDISYSCSIRSENRYSKNNTFVIEQNSSIIIPEQRNYLQKKDTLKLYIVLCLDGSHLVKWTRLYPGGTYTLFRCVTALDKNNDTICASIEILHQHSGTVANSLYPSKRPDAGKLYGVSYRNESHYTGIVWNSNSCTITEQLLAELKPLDIKEITLFNSTAITIKFGLQECESMIAIMDGFEVEYCSIGPSDLCADQMTVVDAKLVRASYPKPTIGSVCKTQNITSSLSFDLIVDGFELSTKYEVRIRYFIEKTSGRAERYHLYPWTESRIFDFVDESARQWFCLSQKSTYVLTTVIFIVILILTGKGISKYFAGLAFIYLRAGAKLPKRFDIGNDDEDRLSEIGLKYWLKPEPDQISGRRVSIEFDSHLESSQNRSTEHFPVESNDQENAYHCSSSVEDDYIQLPVKLGHAQADSMSDLMLDHEEHNRDDRSIGSCSSSFLNQIFDQKTQS